MPTPDPLAALVQLSNRIGLDPRLVQPGGGNTSVKLDDTLFVKGSGTDLRTIGPGGFAHLSLARLAPLAEAESMSDAEMMRFMAGCMLAEGPAPSVETPLHSLLPHRVIAHTHDVATMSLTNVPDATAERLVGELFEGAVVYVPYSRPGFPLARTVGRMAGQIPKSAIGLTLAHHGLVCGATTPTAPSGGSSWWLRRSTSSSPSAGAAASVALVIPSAARDLARPSRKGGVGPSLRSG